MMALLVVAMDRFDCMLILYSRLAGFMVSQAILLVDRLQSLTYHEYMIVLPMLVSTVIFPV